jgi:Type IV secretion system proteins
MLRRRPHAPPKKAGLLPPTILKRVGAFPAAAPSRDTRVIRTILLAGVAALALVTARPADAQMPVIDVKSIDQLVDQLKVLQQQLQQAEQIYQETIGVYNQAVSIVRSVSGLTNAYSLAPGLNTIGSQNPLPTASASLPGFIGGTSSAASLPYGSQYLAQNTIGTLPTDPSFLSTQIRQAVNSISSLQAYANQNLQALEQRIESLPAVVSQIANASTVQQISGLQARLTGEANYATAQQAQAANLHTAMTAQLHAIQMAQLQFAYQQENAGIQATCAALAATAVTITLPSCQSGAATGTTAPASTTATN